ncbi:hypothetical protein MA16_Dca018038 [Dendrobium catenatum]|uniref:Uncharacterized protein n=1 Tax=Dendrobium catenatum TaxID=906689 RepID=A0A2I0WRE2_9ASPA|nr:hypothetical protein MA16_Dca018038 [Dendrobium catenatum]
MLVNFIIFQIGPLVHNMIHQMVYTHSYHQILEDVLGDLEQIVLGIQWTREEVQVTENVLHAAR